MTIYLSIYISFFLLIRQVYKWRIEKKYSYKIPIKRGFGVDRSLVVSDEEVIHNLKLARAIKTLFIIEVVGVLLIFAFAVYYILSY